MTAGFGLEKLGLISLRHPWICLLIIAIITPIAAFGARQLQYSSDIREIFRSNDPAFQQLDLLNDLFPYSQPGVQIVVTADKPFDRRDFETLWKLTEKLEAIDGVTGVLSVFDANTVPDENAETRPLFPGDLSNFEDSPAFRVDLLRHPLVDGKIMSKDWRLTILALSLRNEGQEPERRVVDAIRTTTEEAVAGTDLKAQLTGIAVIRDQIVSALGRDQRTFGLIALAIGLGLCWIFLRRIYLVIIAAIPTIVAITWLRGGMFYFGQDINLLTGIAPTIILVIVLSDCLHLLFAIRRGVTAGMPLEAAVEMAVLQVGPACVLTSLTTALAMASLIWMPHSFIAHFGITTACATALALVVTLLTLPALSIILLRGFANESKGNPQNDMVRKGIDSTCRGAANVVAAVPRAIALVGLLLVVGGFWLHAQNKPQYSYMNNLRPNSSALTAIQDINKKLAGTNSIQVLLDWPEEHGLKSYRTLEIIRKVHKILEREPAFNAVTSLHTVEEWFGDEVEDPEFMLLDYLDTDTAKSFAENFASFEENTLRISARFQEMTSAELEPILKRLDRRLQRLEDAYPGLTVSATGIVPVSSRASHEMIRALNRSLIVAIGLILILIGISMRSVLAGLASVLPNLFPIAMGGAYLHLFEGGLEFTSLVAFSVGFGIAIDSTIHFLNRYRLERSEGTDVSNGLETTIMHVGPVVTMSTVLIASGIGTTLLSSLPMVQLYGTIVVIVLFASMLGCLLFLPSVIATIDPYWRPPWKREQPVEATNSSAR
ncbi:MAG: efflux RND transporter permease subunit [Alphaproteobacteria bacterium]